MPKIKLPVPKGKVIDFSKFTTPPVSKPTAPKYVAFDTETSDAKVWAKQNPEQRKVLKEIVFRWRASSARLPGDRVRWAAYHQDKWLSWLGDMKRRSFERRLAELVVLGLLERQRHRFSGAIIYAWLRPTFLGLEFVGKPSDFELLKPVKASGLPSSSGGTLGGMVGGTLGGALGGNDYTSLPSSSSEATFLKASANKFSEGKGSAGSDVNDNDDVMLDLTKLKEKKLQMLLKQYPKKTGPHEPFVKHPSDMHPKWSSWSPELLAKGQAKYETYVENWYGKYGGKSKTASVDWTDEDEAKWNATVWNLETADDDIVLPVSKAGKPPKFKW